MKQQAQVEKEEEEDNRMREEAETNARHGNTITAVWFRNQNSLTYRVGQVELI